MAARKKQPLSKERIELSALDLIERDGLAGFSTRKLAAALRCEAMSIYYYFPSKGHLLDALVDRIISGMPPIPPADIPWRERIRIASAGWHKELTRWPGLFIYVSTHRLNTPVCLKWLDSVIGLFMQGGLTEEDAVRCFRSFGYYLMGAGLDETAGYARGPSTAEPVSDEVMERDFPNVVRAGPYFRSIEWQATFEVGLDLFLNGIERRAVDRLSA